MRLLLLFMLILAVTPIGYCQKGSSSYAEDTLEVYNMFELASEIYHNDADSTIRLCQRALEKSMKINYIPGISEGYGWLGYMYQFKGDYAQAMF